VFRFGTKNVSDEGGGFASGVKIVYQPLFSILFMFFFVMRFMMPVCPPLVGGGGGGGGGGGVRQSRKASTIQASSYYIS
jgi:hypothetical protein